MNVLIIGTGVIGTIYGWALKEAGHKVTHLVRTPKPELSINGVKIDILDERKGFKKYNQTTYSIEISENINSSNDFDLVIVPTNWYQTESALKGLFPKCPKSFYYILTSNWTGTEMFDRVLPKNQYILGYPDGGGTIKSNVYWTNIGPGIHIAKPDHENQNGFNLIKEAFSQAKIKMDVQENMLHWLWVHNAGSIAISLALQKYRKADKFLDDKKLLKDSFFATRECLDLCEKRGAYSNKYPEISAFKWPMWLLIPMFKFNFKHNESMKRYSAHGESMPIDDIACNYYDILNTAKEYKFAMPYFNELEKIIKQSTTTQHAV